MRQVLTTFLRSRLNKLVDTKVSSICWIGQAPVSPACIFPCSGLLLKMQIAAKWAEAIRPTTSSQ
ncbi:MAG: hypothetical protein K0Q83_3968 [Deltaproteobacteria bacterium]|nr:hypothetical protein [Deltaproteobacteria bacterium]